MMERMLVSIAETTKILGVGRSTIYRMIGDNQVATVKIGRRRLVKVETILKLVDGGSTPLT